MVLEVGTTEVSTVLPPKIGHLSDSNTKRKMSKMIRKFERYNFPEDDEKKMVKESKQFERYCNYGKNLALEQCQYSDRSGLMKNKLKHIIIMVHCSASKHNVLKFPKYSEGCCDASEIKCIVNIKKNQLFLSLGRVHF